ncbi:MAG: sulfite exporter TauE/SafE family protein [Verrucomicrobiota bacterium]|nr:sulfite exporter TauE/SafE family protein [Verrucomicrobiota bacterium]
MPKLHLMGGFQGAISATTYIAAGIIGLLGGIASGLFGVGGGIIMVPAMTLAMGLDIKRAVGTSLAVIIPTAIIGTWKHHGNSYVDWRIALCLIPTALLGSSLGADLAHRLSAETLKQAFGGFLIVVGIKLLFFR